MNVAKVSNTTTTMISITGCKKSARKPSERVKVAKPNKRCELDDRREDDEYFAPCCESSAHPHACCSSCGHCYFCRATPDRCDPFGGWVEQVRREAMKLK